MLIPLFRTLILYLAIITAVRMMGKRQVGEMQPTELVITILVSAVASVPMQDLDIPLAHGLIPVFTLIAAEVLVSALTLKWTFLRHLLSGRPVPVIQNGIICQSSLRELRLSVEDLLEDLRLNGVFDLRQVAFAQIETNGQLSVLLKGQGSPAASDQMGVSRSETGPFYVLIADGKTDANGMKAAGFTQKTLDRLLQKQGVQQKAQVFLLCTDPAGNLIYLPKEESKCEGGS